MKIQVFRIYDTVTKTVHIYVRINNHRKNTIIYHSKRIFLKDLTKQNIPTKIYKSFDYSK